MIRARNGIAGSRHPLFGPRQAQSETHRQVDGPDMLGKAAEGYEIDAGFGNGAQAGLVDPARCLELRLSRNMRDGATGGFQIELVEHDHIRACGQRLVELFEILHFDFHDDMRRNLSCAPHGVCNRTCGSNVVLLYQDGIEQADAMVRATTDRHGVLLRGAQAGQCLARIENPALRSGNELREMARRRRRA